MLFQQCWLCFNMTGIRSSHDTRLVFIDETAVSTNLARLRGRAPRGVRVIGTVPLGAWEMITFVAALRHNKMTAPMVIADSESERSRTAVKDMSMADY
jgi:hypothetical protein